MCITRGTILKGNDTVLCANVLANNDGTDFSCSSVAVQQAIAEIPVNLLREWFLPWVKRCRRCVHYEGHYSERE